jgi:glycolate oxidase iron-sulfur subunit
LEDLNELKKIEQYVDQCMKCGFCTFFCPIYQEELVESSVARGKIFLTKQVLKGEQQLSDQAMDIIGKCLLCKACAVNCPAKTQVDRVIVGARAEQVRQQGLPLLKRLIFRHVMANRRLFGWTVKLASKLQWMIPGKQGRMKHLPDFLKALGQGRNIPAISSVLLRDQVQEVNPPRDSKAPRMRVGYFMGCATDFIFPETGLKTIEFLTRHGIEVVVPKAQSCCGAAIYFSGDLETGRMLAYKNMEAFKDVDYVVTTCATCSSSLKDYKVYLPENDRQRKDFEAFSKKIKDVTEFIVDVLDIPPEEFHLRKEFQGKTITWHDPCHLVRYQNIRNQPRRILQALEGSTYVEMPNADRCCGMGGSFSIYHYELTKKIADRKVESVKATAADIVVTACPGCMINLSDHLQRAEMPQQVRHLMDLLE